jgi:hypothetical protein
MNRSLHSAALVLVVSCALATAGCASRNPAVPTAVPAGAQLRIENVGTQDILSLTVSFPGSGATGPAQRVWFGDVLAGETSAYQTVPHGVYRYAAYEYFLVGEWAHQPVLDWVGEKPMAGERFTYRISLEIQERIGAQIQLIEAVSDVP